MAYTLPQKDWTAFKAVVIQRSLYIYEIKGTEDCYLLIASDNGIIVECCINKSTEAEDKTDYENNYRSDITKCCANGFK